MKQRTKDTPEIGRTVNGKKWHFIPKGEWRKSYCGERLLRDDQHGKLFDWIAPNWDTTMNACDECLHGHKDALENPTDFDLEREWASNHMSSIMGGVQDTKTYDDFGDWLQADDEEAA